MNYGFLGELKMKKVLIALIMASVCITAAFAIDDPAGVTVTEDNRGTLTATSAATNIAEGGNVSDLNLETNTSTIRWAGFVGNVSGEVNLGRGTDVLYSFGDAEFSTVFATTSAAYAWSTLEAGTAASVDTVWGFSAGADQAVDAFTGSTAIESITVPTVTFEDATFTAGIFDDGSSAVKNDFAFGAPVLAAAAGFSGKDVEYEIMVPTTEGGTDTYYFYVTLS